MKIHLTVVFLFMVATRSFAQQRPQYTQYMLNKYQENPAYGGLERSLSVFTSYRDQYSTFPGNPKTLYIGADMPFYLWNGAVGFSLYNHTAGLFNNTNMKFSYNNVMGTPYGFLSFGARVGFDFISVDGAGIITPDGVYTGVVNHNDPNLTANNFNGLGLSYELGGYFRGQDLEVGVTIGELPDHSFSLGTGTYRRAFYSSLFTSYDIELPSGIRIQPATLLKIDKAVFQLDAGMMAYFNTEFFGGINLRGYSGQSLDAIGLIFGTNIGSKYKISYSYDIGLSSLNNYNQGGHEIMLNYNLQRLIGIGLPPKIIYNPRDL